MNQKQKKLLIGGIVALIAIPLITSVIVAKNQCSDSLIAKVLGISSSCPSSLSTAQNGEISFTDAAGNKTNLNLSELAQFIAEEKKNGGVNFDLAMTGDTLSVTAENGNKRTLDLSEFAKSVVDTAINNPDGDSQVLAIRGTILTISGGNTIDLAQTLGLADYFAGTGITISGSRVISTTLGTSIGTSEVETGAITTDKIADGSILFADLNDNECQGGQIIKYSGTDWTCGTGIAVGDVKTGMQAVDHGGWVKLDGRALSSLTDDQRTAATALGLSTSLPNANNAFLVQNGGAVGTVGGSNERTLARNQLPDVALGGTTNATGAHTHNVTYNEAANWGNWRAGLSDTTPSELRSTTVTSTSAGNHAHTVTTDSINGGVTQQNVSITPRSLSVNMFIYLGL